MSPLSPSACRLFQVLSVITCFLLGAGGEALGETGATIGLSFTGGDQRVSGFFVSDTMGAVGPNHIVEMINGLYTVYDKATGGLLQRMSLNGFWRSAFNRGEGGTSEVCCDPRINYDPLSDRWFSASLAANDGNESDILVAVSITDDPTIPASDLNQGWRGYRLDGDPSADPNTRQGDFPTLGFDANGVYITTRIRDRVNIPAAEPRGLAIYSIPKADLLATSPTVANSSTFVFNQPTELDGAAAALQVALNTGAASARVPVFLVNPNVGLKRWDLQNRAEPQAGAATLSHLPIDIPIASFDTPPTAEQPGNVPNLFNSGPYNFPGYGLVPNIVSFSSSLVQQGDHVWGVHVAKAGDRSGLRWVDSDAPPNLESKVR